MFRLEPYIDKEIDIVTAGAPCQPYSHAGKRKGALDDRDLWPEALRIVEIARPSWFVGENVVGFAKLGLDQMSLKLESLGYTVQTLDIPAGAVNAWHQCKVDCAGNRDGGRLPRYDGLKLHSLAQHANAAIDLVHLHPLALRRVVEYGNQINTAIVVSVVIPYGKMLVGHHQFLICAVSSVLTAFLKVV